MKKMWTLKNAAVAVLGALFLGGICKLGIFFSVMLGISLFLLVPGIMSGLQKERESSERFFDRLKHHKECIERYQQCRKRNHCSRKYPDRKREQDRYQQHRNL